MISVCVSEKFIEIVEIKEQLFGKAAELAYHRIDVSDKQYIPKLKAWVRGKKMLLCVPDDPSVPKKIKINGELKGRLLTEEILDKIGTTLPFPVAGLAYDYEVTAKGSVLFFGTRKSVIVDLAQKLKGAVEEITAVIPDPLCVFEVIRDGFKEDNIVLYIKVIGGNAELYLYRSDGLIESLSRDLDATGLEEWFGLVIDESNKKAGENLTNIIISGEIQSSSGLESMLANRGVALRTASEIITNKAKSLKVNLPKTEIDFSSILAPFGALLYSRNKGAIDLSRSLNISEEMHKVEATRLSAERKSDNKSKFSFRLVKVLLFVIFFLSIPFLIYLSYGFIKDARKERVEEIIIPTSTPLPNKEALIEASVSASTTPSPASAVSRKDIRVQILNGSGKQGVASSLSKKLTALEYATVTIGNADRSDYERTVIRVFESGGTMGELVLSDIKDIYPTAVVEKTLEENSSVDVRVIIGLK